MRTCQSRLPTKVDLKTTYHRCERRRSSQHLVVGATSLCTYANELDRARVNIDAVDARTHHHPQNNKATIAPEYATRRHPNSDVHIQMSVTAAPCRYGWKPRPLGRDRVPVIGNVDARSGRFIAPSGCAMSGCAMTVHVGQPLTRREDARLLSGRGRYVDDVHLDGMVHAALFRSSRAHGRIRSIDVAAASAVLGVIAVFTPADLAAVLKPIRPRIAAMPGFEHFLQLPLATDKVRYVGEPMAVVVATTPYIAEDAASLISADIEDLPPVLTWEQAGDRPVLIHDGAGTNISSVEVGRGDADAAFKAAYYVRRERFTVHRHTAVPWRRAGWSRRGTAPRRA